MGLRMKNFTENSTLGWEFTKRILRGLGQFADVKGGLGKEEGGGDPPMHTMNKNLANYLLI